MQTAVLNDELKLCYPDSFHVLDETEKSALKFLGTGPGICLSDPERHILISIGWKSISGLAAMLVNSKDAAKRMEADISKPMLAYGCDRHGFAEKSVGSETASGFSYVYEAEGVEMYGESFALKHGRTLYYLNLYARRNMREESVKTWSEILSNAEWC